MRRRDLTAALFVLGAASLAGCNQDMADQPKDKPYRASQVFPDGTIMRPPVPGTVARPVEQAAAGYAAPAVPAGRTVRSAAPPMPAVMDTALLERGRDRFAIFCAPCHGGTGDGRGMIVERGFPAPPSFHIARLRKAPARHFYDVITNGYGNMYAYDARVEPADRWAIAAYIRALQASQNFPARDLPPDEQAKLDAAATPSGPRGEQ